MRPCHACAFVLLPFALVATGCGEETPDPVATVDVEPTELTLPYPGQARFEALWRPSAELGPGGGEPIVFVHLLDAEGEVARTFDHRFPAEWRIGGEQADPIVLFQSLLGPPLPAGDYRLTLGLYGSEGRWALDAGEEVAKREYAVATVQVPELAPAAVPKLDFADGWLALEPGQDRQVLGSRWLSTGGAIGVAAVPESGHLTLHLEVPPSHGGNAPVFAAGAAVQRLKVVSSCDGESDEIVGSGLGFAVVSVPAEAGCEIRLEPNFFFLPTGSEMPRSVRLVQLFWNGESDDAQTTRAASE